MGGAHKRMSSDRVAESRFEELRADIAETQTQRVALLRDAIGTEAKASVWYLGNHLNQCVNG